MNQDELRRVIEEPARRGGWQFEPGVVELFLRDVGNEPGALPLLSHALLETWSRGCDRSDGKRSGVLRIAYSVLHVAYCIFRIAYCVLRIVYCG